MIRTDNAICVDGSLSYEDDAPPRVLVSNMVSLVDNADFKPMPTQKVEVREEKQREIKVKKLYLRVPSMGSNEFRKCENLVAIFPGNVQIVYYDSSEKKYVTSGQGISLSAYLMTVLESYVGKENVVYK